MVIASGFVEVALGTALMALAGAAWLALAGPLLVGVLRGATGGYDGMFVLVLAGVAGLWILGRLVTRPRFVDDEVDRSVPGWSTAGRPREDAELLESAGAEAPVTAQVRPGDGSPRG